MSRLLEYNLDDEEEDFLNADHSASLPDHIYGAMLILQEALLEGYL